MRVAGLRAGVLIPLLLILLLFASVGCGHAGECSVCKGGSPSAQQDVLEDKWSAFFSGSTETGEETGVVSSSTGLVSPQASRAASAQAEASGTAAPVGTRSGNAAGSSERGPHFSALVPIERAHEYDIILDISPEPTEFIPGAIHISYTDFLNADNALRSVPELSAILGAAGIGKNDSVLIYGECQPCGGGPSAASYVYWIMRYLGHERLGLLDASIDDWVAEGLSTNGSASLLPPKDYTASVNSSLLANWDLVNGDGAQIIDARSSTEFEAGSIPGSTSIPYDRVLDGKRIRDESDLRQLFSFLDEERPVVAFTNTGVKASMLWLPLDLLGYDARIYSWKEYQAMTTRYKNPEGE